jgi:membrane protein DedA with SNARE-associated domain
MSFETITHGVVDFVRTNQGWAPFIVGLLAFGESLAVLSLLFPATVMLLAIGGMIGGMGLEFWPIWLAAVLGASLGDWLSYEVSRHFGEPIQHMWPLNRAPATMAKAERFIQRHGVWGVFLGRFFGPLRAVVPLVAGIFHMPRFPFQLANIGSALLWSTLLLAPGAGIVGWLRG